MDGHCAHLGGRGGGPGSCTAQWQLHNPSHLEFPCECPMRLQGLALVCKGWLDALRSHTPVCFDLSKPAHLEPAALAWLSSVPLEVRGCGCLWVPLQATNKALSALRWACPRATASFALRTFNSRRCCAGPLNAADCARWPAVTKHTIWSLHPDLWAAGACAAQDHPAQWSRPAPAV